MKKGTSGQLRNFRGSYVSNKTVVAGFASSDGQDEKEKALAFLRNEKNARFQTVYESDNGLRKLILAKLD